MRPIIVFDGNETLLGLDSIRPTFDRIFSGPAALRLWFAHLITYSEALTLAGVYVPFTDIGGAVLRMLTATRGTRSVTPTARSSPTGSPACRRIPRFPRPCAGSATMASGCSRSLTTRWRSPGGSWSAGA
ncbi:MAG: hypothetical protein ACRDRJ_08120 [Streptosporangiaceae bacterium]